MTATRMSEEMNYHHRPFWGVAARIQIQPPALEGSEKIRSAAFGLETSHQGMMECTAGEVLASPHAGRTRAFGLDCGRQPVNL